ncbi:MAG: type II secretion system F family protein [Chloroflexota bacterium]|nr:type II secretion system F family protein [Chloroflexota bacterium]
MTLTLLLPLLAAGMAGLAVLTVVYGVRSMASRDANVDARMTTYVNSEAADNESPAMFDSQFAEKLNDAIKRQSFAERIEQDLAQANLLLTVPEYLLIRLAIPLVLSIAALLFWRSIPLVPFAMALGYILPILWLRQRRSRRNRDFNDQLAETLSLTAASMRGGFSLVQSLANVSKDSQEPTKSELRRVGQEIQLGLSLTQSLDNLVSRMESEDLDLVATAIKIHARVGGNLTTILDNISTTVRERAKLRREVRVITSMQRISSYIIGFLPVGLALIIFVINPKYMMKLFEPGWTLCIPIGAVFFWIVGFIVIQKVVDIKV